MIQAYGKLVEEFEKELHKIDVEFLSDPLFESLLPMDLNKKTETSMTFLKDFIGNLKDYMLTIKPEKNATIEQSYNEVIQRFENFNDVLLQETEDPKTNSRLAIEELRDAISRGKDFLDLSKEIRDSPSPIIQEVSKLREVYQTKEYLSNKIGRAHV